MENPTPYISKLSLHNIKCFGKRQELSFEKDGKPIMWTMILGDNGIGKSTVLKAIAACLASDDYVPSYIQDSNLLRHGAKKGQARINLFYPGAVLPVMRAVEIEGIDFYMAGNTVLPVGKYLPSFGYGSYRKFSNSSFVVSEKDFTFGSLFNEDTNLTNPEEWLLQTDYERLRGDSDGSRFDKVENIILEILKGDVNDIKLAKDKSGKTRVQFLTAYGWVKLKELSTGYKSLITWMVDLASRLETHYPQSEDPLKEPAIVLIDEIDLHLHVSLQKTIVSFLKETFPKVQFIVTAHSPLMVFGSPDSSIVLLENDGDTVKISRNDISVKNWRVDQILTSDLFGLDTARAPDVEESMKRRVELLERNSLTNVERTELAGLNEQIDAMPTYEDESLNKAHDIIRRAAQKLKASAK